MTDKKLEEVLNELRGQVLIVLADYQTTKDPLHFARHESRRVEVAERIIANARLILETK